MTDRVIITQGRYAVSAVKKEQYPQERRKEIVFIGRSNVGKSSLINSLTRVKNLARVSSQPGKTQTINFYALGAKGEGTADRKSFYLVDLPGYGYAKKGKERRKMWSAFIEDYLLHSPQLQFVCQLIDIRHAPMRSDIEMFSWLVRNGIPVLVIATKADKLSRGPLARQLAVIARDLALPPSSVHPYSSATGLGRDGLLDVFRGILLQ